jgi:hypothetical protein
MRGPRWLWRRSRRSWRGSRLTSSKIYDRTSRLCRDSGFYWFYAFYGFYRLWFYRLWFCGFCGL